MDTKESQRIKVQGYSAQDEKVGRDREGARSLHEGLGGDGDGHPRTWEREPCARTLVGSRRSLFFFQSKLFL